MGWAVGLFLLGFYLTRSLPESLAFVVLTYVIAYFSIFVHELGHAIAARFVGMRMLTFSIGGGVRQKVFRIGRYVMFFRPFPSEGHIRFIPTDLAHYRKKLALVLVAGPATNIFIGIGAIWFGLTYFDQMPVELNRVLRLVAVINLTMGVMNLWPSTVQHGQSTINTDGSQLLGIRTLKNEDIQQLLDIGPLVHFELEFFWGDKNKALRHLKKVALDVNAPIEYQVSLTAAYAEASQIVEAIHLGRQLLSRKDLSIEHRAVLENNLAFALIMDADHEDLKTADALSQSAMSVLPMQLEIVMTRAAVLAKLNNYEAVLKLLDDKRFVLLNITHQATVAVQKAVAFASLGQGECAVQELRKALDLEPDNVGIEQFRRQFPQLADGKP